jgi:hypothetical protein
VSGWAVGKTTEPEPQRSQLNDAIFITVRGSFRILGEMVQMAAGITKLVAVTAIKAASAVEAAVETTEREQEEVDQKPSKAAGSRGSRGSRT